MTHDLTTIVRDCSFTEAPRWHGGRLWFSDFYTCLVQSVAEDGSDLRVEAEVPGQPSGLGWLPDGRLLIVSQLDRRLVRREPDGSLVTHAELGHLVGGHLNDMVVDDQGRAYVGNFGFDLMSGEPVTSTVLVRVDPDGAATPVADDLWFPNGAALTADGRLLVGETFGNRVSAFAVAADGSLGERTTWAGFGPDPVEADFETALGRLGAAPDGCAIDAEGLLWVADAIGQRALRAREGGEVVEEVAAPLGVYACALGGHDGHTLFLCAAPDFVDANRRPVRESVILTTRVDVGAP